MPKSPRSPFALRVLIRLLLWSLPVVLVAVLMTETRRLEQEAVFWQAGSLLVQGQWEAAQELLLADRSESAHALPLPLMARTAFERGEFERARQFLDLSERLGKPTVPALEAAVAIESGTVAVSEEVVGAWKRAPVKSRLLERLDGFENEATWSGQVVRDRTGRPIATFEDGTLDLLDDVRSEWIPRALEEALAERPKAGSLRSSLDLEISAAALRAFGRYYRGSIVIVDPQRGDVLAAVSDPRTHRQGGTPAFEQFREPASVSKLITATAALRAGHDPDTAFRSMQCRGHERYSGEFLYCPHIVGPLRSLDRAMAVSCNVAFANLGVEIGRRALLDELRAFGFDDFSRPFPGASILEPYGDNRQLADLSIGLDDTEITPLHGALMAAVMANDGVMPTPRLLVSEDGRLGLHPRPFPSPEGRRVLDAHWVPRVVQSMEAVAQRGTARNMANSRFPVAMKTGTASHPMHGFHVNYVGIGPMPEARLAFCVRITNQRTSRKVRAAAREVTTRLLRSLGYIAERRGWNDGSTGHPMDALASAPHLPASPGTTGSTLTPSERVGRR